MGLVVVAGLFAPTNARAECGNYIVYTDSAQRRADDPPMGEHRGPDRCHGPNCSNAPPASPVPRAPQMLRVLVDDPLVTDDGESLVPSSHPLLFDPPFGDMVRRPTDVYRPPR